MMLGAVLPEMREQAEALAADLAELLRIRKSIADERDRLDARHSLVLDGRAPAHVAADRGAAKQQAEAEKALAAERRARRATGPPGG